jgi:stage V sporulation protein D (sporulation-specific penicillin-binding protein)
MKRRKAVDVRPKILFIRFVFIIILVGLVGRIFFLKVAKSAEYESKAKTQQVSRYDITISPNRGAILDRNNQALAVSTTVYNMVLDARNLSKAKESEQEKTLKIITEHFEELDYDTLKQYITINPQTQKPNLDTHWKYLVKGIERSEKEELEAQGLKGIVFEQSTKRSYPLKTLACHVLGFIRGDTQWGIESMYNSYMTGMPGRSFMTYDGGNMAVHKDYNAQDGNTIVTTLDYTIQQYAEDAVAEVAAQWPSENVAAMVMNPKTGEVYAMADSHQFDLNHPSEPLELQNEEFKKDWEKIDADSKMEYLNNTWKNFNISSTYEPGSIFKPLVVAAALEENVVSPSTSFYCSGVTKVYDRDIRCHLRSGHGAETLEDVIANSCNMGMIDIANKMGRKLFYQYQKEFGFGEKTGIDLPGEVSASNLMYSEERIGPVELATMSFGQSFNCTSIQILSAFSSLVNGGNLMKPYVVSQILDTEGNVIVENKPQIIRKVISQKTSDIMREQMQATVERGTGKKAKIEGYAIGGKTGTAEQGNRSSNSQWTLSYIAYFPVEDPQYIVLTVIHRPSDYVDGVQTPSPMTKKLIENIIQYKNLEPSYVVEEEKSKTTAGKVKIDDYTGESLYNVLGALDSKGIGYKVVGTGNTITNQAPHGGAEIEVGGQIILYVKKGEDEGGLAVPNVVGKKYEEAVTALNDMGFEVETQGDTEGVVVKQSPLYGISAEKGSTVSLTIEKKTDTQQSEAASQ